jgi:hypothetical protein
LANLPKDHLTIICNPMVVNTGSKLVLIDAGYGAVGPRPPASCKPMAAAGLDPRARGSARGLFQERAPRHGPGIARSDEIRVEQGGRPRGHRDRDGRPYARAYVLRHQLGFRTPAGAVRRDQSSGAVVRNPTWSAVFDIDGPKAIETRRKFYDMAVAEKALIAGFHYPFPSLGHVEKDGAGYRLVPIAWNPSI